MLLLVLPAGRGRARTSQLQALYLKSRSRCSAARGGPDTHRAVPTTAGTLSLASCWCTTWSTLAARGTGTATHCGFNESIMASTAPTAYTKGGESDALQLAGSAAAGAASTGAINAYRRELPAESATPSAGARYQQTTASEKTASAAAGMHTHGHGERHSGDGATAAVAYHGDREEDCGTHGDASQPTPLVVFVSQRAHRARAHPHVSGSNLQKAAWQGCSRFGTLLIQVYSIVKRASQSKYRKLGAR